MAAYYGKNQRTNDTTVHRQWANSCLRRKLAFAQFSRELFALSWELIDDKIICFGIDSYGNNKYFPYSSDKIGLYVCVRSLDMIDCLRCLCLVKEVKVIRTNIITTSDAPGEHYDKTLIKLFTGSFSDSVKLYYLLKDVTQYEVVVSSHWSLQLFMLYEFHCKYLPSSVSSFSNLSDDNNAYLPSSHFNNVGNDHSLNDTTTTSQTTKTTELSSAIIFNYVWLSDDLDFFPDKPSPLIPAIAFDIETGHPDANRVPTGEDIADIIISIAVIFQEMKQTYVLSNLPFRERLSRQEVNSITPVVNDVDDNDDKNFSATTTTTMTTTIRIQVIDCYSEKELLTRFLDLIDVNTTHYLVGYNSKEYDLTYIVRRLHILGMFEQLERFYWNKNNIHFGECLVHVDLFLYFLKFYNSSGIPRFDLDTVSKHFLGSNKMAVDSRDIRFLYGKLLLEGPKSLTKSFNFANRRNMYKKKNTLDVINLRDVLHYNVVDTLLTLELFTRYTTIELYCREYKQDVHMLINNTSSGFTMLKFHLRLLENGAFMTANHPTKYLCTDHGWIVFSSIGSSAGGENYIFKTGYYSTMYAIDYTAFYPFIISTFNLSYENCVILNKRELLFLKATDFFDSRNVTILFYEDNRGRQFELKKLTAIDKNVLTALKFNGRRDVRLFCTWEDVVGPRYAQDQLFVCLISSMKAATTAVFDTKGILPTYMLRQNNIRDVTKFSVGQLKQVLSDIHTIELEREIHPYCAGKNADDTESSSAENSSDSEDDDKAELIAGQDLIDFHTKEVNIFPILRLKQFPASKLTDYKTLVKESLHKQEALYRMLKIENASYFGFLGSKTAYACPNVFAATTDIGRIYISYTVLAFLRHSCRIIYVDTDSACATNLNKPISTIMSNITELPKIPYSMKVEENVMIFARKTYVFDLMGKYNSRGIVKHGIKAIDLIFDHMIKNYIRFRPTIFIPDVPKHYENIYELVFKTCTSLDDVILTTSIKSDYINKTPISDMLERIRIEMPHVHVTNKITYTYLYVTSPQVIHLIPTCMFDRITIYDVNFYRLLSIVLKYFGQILIGLVKTSYVKKYGMSVTLSSKELEIINSRSFMKIRSQFLPVYKNNVNMKQETCNKKPPIRAKMKQTTILSYFK